MEASKRFPCLSVFTELVSSQGSSKVMLGLGAALALAPEQLQSTLISWASAASPMLIEQNLARRSAFMVGLGSVAATAHEAQ